MTHPCQVDKQDIINQCYADLQLYIDGHATGTSTDQEKVVVRWANVLQWFSVRASWVHSVEIRNFSEDFGAQHDCPPGGITTKQCMM